MPHRWKYPIDDRNGYGLARPADPVMAPHGAALHAGQSDYGCTELSADLVAWIWQVALQLHLVVQDTADFNDGPTPAPGAFCKAFGLALSSASSCSSSRSGREQVSFVIDRRGRPRFLQKRNARDSRASLLEASGVVSAPTT